MMRRVVKRPEMRRDREEYEDDSARKKRMIEYQGEETGQ